MQLRSMSTPRSSAYCPLFKVSALPHLRMLFLCTDAIVNFRVTSDNSEKQKQNSLGQTNFEKEVQSPTSALPKCTQDEHFEIVKLLTALE